MSDLLNPEELAPEEVSSDAEPIEDEVVDEVSEGVDEAPVEESAE